MSKRERNQDNTVYVGNLDEQVTSSLLYELFIQVAPITSVYLPKDRILKTHQGYGFVEFKNFQDVDYVEKAMTGVKLYNKMIKINKVQNKQEVELGSTLFIKNLDKLVDQEQLSTIFKQFGSFNKPPKLVITNKDTNHAFIYFKNFKQSDEALSKMQDQFILNKKIQIDYSMKSGGGKHGDEIDRLLQQQ